MFYTRPDICTKDRTESMMMGIFQTNSITIRQQMKYEEHFLFFFYNAKKNEYEGDSNDNC